MSTIEMAVGEIERELNVRDSVYPRLVDQGKLSQGEADRRRRCLLWAIQWLEWLAKDAHGVSTIRPDGNEEPIHRHD